MFLRRPAIALSRRALTAPIASRRVISSSIVRRDTKHSNVPAQTEQPARMVPFEEIKTEQDLLAPGAEPGTVPTDWEQSTGLERLEILGKMQGIDIFDMKPLDASRMGTLDNPIMVRSFGDEQYAGCTGYPADSHHVLWQTMSRDRPVARCPECGNVLKMEYVGPMDDPHAAHGHGHGHGHGHDHSDGSHKYEGEAKTMADFVRPEYW